MHCKWLLLLVISTLSSSSKWFAFLLNNHDGTTYTSAIASAPIGINNGHRLHRLRTVSLKSEPVSCVFQGLQHTLTRLHHRMESAHTDTTPPQDGTTDQASSTSTYPVRLKPWVEGQHCRRWGSTWNQLTFTICRGAALEMEAAIGERKRPPPRSYGRDNRSSALSLRSVRSVLASSLSLHLTLIRRFCTSCCGGRRRGVRRRQATSA